MLLKPTGTENTDPWRFLQRYWTLLYLGDVQEHQPHPDVLSVFCCISDLHWITITYRLFGWKHQQLWLVDWKSIPCWHESDWASSVSEKSEKLLNLQRLTYCLHSTSHFRVSETFLTPHICSLIHHHTD